MGATPEPTIESQHLLRPMVVAVLLGAAAIAAAGSSGAPTGIGWWDTFLATALAAAVTLAGLKAKPWVVIVALAALAPFGPSAALPFVVATIGLILATQWFGTNASLEWACASGAALASMVALRLNAIVPLESFGAPSVLAGATLLMIATGGLAASSSTVRRNTARSVVVIAALVVAALAPLAVLGPAIETDARAGAAAARSGASAGRSGETVQAISDLRSAEQSFQYANERITSRWLAAARLVPVVSQHIEAGTVMTDQGTAMASAAVVAAAAADPVVLRGSSGILNLSAVDQAAAPLDNFNNVLSEAQQELAATQSAWLIPPVERQRQRAAQEVAEALPAARAASDAIDALPHLLGSDEPRRYLVLLATPAEARELGGFVGNYLELIVDRGELSIGEAGRIGDLHRRGPAVLPNPDQYPLRYLANDPEQWPQNWTGLPDFPLVAKAVRGMYPSIGGSELDGVLYVDPVGMAALLELTGPVDVPEIGRTLDHTTMADYLLFEQYGGFDLEEKQERAELLDQISLRTFAALTTADLSDPQHIASVVEPVANGGHLLMTVFDPDADAFLASLGLRGAFPEPDGTDFLSVVHANTSPNKLDTFLRRSIQYSIDLDGTGVEATVDIELHNSAPDDLPPYVYGNDGNADGLPFGTNLVHLSIYTNHQLTGAAIAGAPTPIESHTELGYNRYLIVVPVGLGDTVPVRFELAGSTDQIEGSYEVTVANQALATADSLEVTVTNGEETETQGLDLDSDLRLRFFSESP